MVKEIGEMRDRMILIALGAVVRELGHVKRQRPLRPP